MTMQYKAVIDKVLTQASNMLVPEGFIGDLILPPVYVKNFTGRLGKYGNNHLRLAASLGGGRGKYKRIESVSRDITTSYDIESHGLEDVNTRRDYANVELPFNCDNDLQKALTTLLMVKSEYAIASALGDTGTITQNTTLVGQSQFSDYDNSNPITVSKTAREAVYDGCGMAPNKAIMSWKVWNVLRFHPAFLNMGFVQNRAGGLSPAEMALALDVDQVLIGKAVYNAAKEGQADSIQPIWGKNLVFCYAPQAADLYQTSLGYKVLLDSQRAAGRRAVYKYALNNPPESNAILVEDHWDDLLSNLGAAYLVKDAIA